MAAVFPLERARPASCYTVCAMVRKWRPSWSFTVVGFVALVAACASPTLPLPPPAVPDVAYSQTDPTMVHLTSVRGAEPNAIIVIFNASAAVPLDKRVTGSQADAEGTWDANVVASRGDVLEITQESGVTRSPPADVQVP